MTGFSNRVLEKNNYSLTVSVKSLNSRYLDLKLNCSSHVLGLEKKIRTLVKKHLVRGFIELNVSYIPFDLSSDTKGLKEWVNSYKKTSIKLGVEDHLDLETVLKKSSQHGFLSLSKSIEKEILECVEKSIRSLKEERLKEGRELKILMLESVNQAKTIFKKIESKISVYRKDLKSKWIKKIKLIKSEVSDERLSFEVALFLEKADVSEELDRLKVHFFEFLKIMNSKNNLKGKKLDFYCQELNREASTIGSKAKDSSVTKLLVDLKSNFEVLREQVQNIQ
jgi:uncharacterized protein (TIGR00255 family)